MVVDVTKIKHGGEIPVSETVFVADSDFDFKAAVKAEGVIVRVTETPDGYTFFGSISGNIRRQCARCLSEIRIPYKCVINQISDTQYDDSEIDLLEAASDTIDLSELIISLIRADLPIASVCSDNCKGLCDICGVDLNSVNCNCVREIINPQFDKLKEMLKDNEEV